MNAYNALRRPLLKTAFLVMVLVTGSAILAFDKVTTKEATPLSNPTLEQTQEQPEPVNVLALADKNGKVRAPRASAAKSRASSSSRSSSGSRASSPRSSSTRRASDSGRSRASNSRHQSTYVSRDRKGVVRGTRNHGSTSRPGRGHGSHRGHYYGGYGSYYGYGSFGYYPSYLGWGLYPWSWFQPWSFSFSWPYYSGYYSPYHSYGYNDQANTAGALDLNVKPKRTKIYLDGRYIGKADQFDGFPGYLWVGEGNHELIFYLDGHETVRKEYAVVRGSVQRDRFYMDQGEPTPPEALSKVKQPITVKKEMKHSDRATAQRRFSYVEPQKPAPAAVAKVSDEEDLDLRTEPGRLRFTIQPSDASIYLDGNFLGTATDLRNREGDILVDSGNHILEIVRPGYASKKLEFVVIKGETINLTQNLDKK